MAFLLPLIPIAIGSGLIVASTTADKRSRQNNQRLVLASNPKPLNLRITQAPSYRLPSERALERDNARIEREIGLVEAAAESRNDYNAERQAQDPEIVKLLDIVRDFIRDKGLPVYGGSSLNALMPDGDKFYDYSKQIPDYDFFSSNAQQDAMELADRFYAAGYKDAQARSGVHPGTFKVSSNFTQLADITQMPAEALEQMDIVKGTDGLLYVGPLYLRIDLYKQLAEQSQPDRWPKVWKRLQLLNRNYPMPCKKSDLRPLTCVSQNTVDFGKFAEFVIAFIKNNRCTLVGSILPEIFTALDYKLSPEIKSILSNLRCTPNNISYVDVFHEWAADLARFFVIIYGKKYPQLGLQVVVGAPAKEIFSERYIVTTKDGVQLIEFLLPDKCLAITEINSVQIGTIDTILAVMFSKLFVDQGTPEEIKGKQLCLMQYLMEAIRDNVQYASDSGEYARFPMRCVGPNHTLADIFRERWQERVNRLISRHQGKEVEKSSGMFSYRPNDIALARAGLVDSRLAEIEGTMASGKHSLI